MISIDSRSLEGKVRSLSKQSCLHFLESVESVRGEDLEDTKNFLKFIKNRKFFENDQEGESPLSEELLIKYFRFNIEGFLETLDQKDCINHIDLYFYKIFFINNAANVSKNLAERTQDPFWYEMHYEFDMMAGEIAFDVDPLHAGYCFGYAANAAKDLYHLTGNLDWLVASSEGNQLAAEMIYERDVKHSAYSYGFWGDDLKELFLRTRDLDTLDLWEDVQGFSVLMCLLFNETHAAYCLSFLSRALYLKYDNTGDVFSLKKAYEYEQIALGLSDQPRFVAYSHLRLGDRAKELFHISQSERFKKRSIYHYATFLELARGNIPRDEYLDYIDELSGYLKLLTKKDISE